jgi:hypothetical protein
VDGDGVRWLTLTLIGEDWPKGWSVDYQYLESWGMLDWFASAPAEGEGLVAGRKYRMSPTPQPSEFAGFVDNLHTLISQIKPVVTPEATLVIEDEREYE